MNNKKFHLEICEAVPIALQPSCEERKWGRWQFPMLTRTMRGHALTTFEYGTDSIQYEATQLFSVSEDGGLSWREKNDKDIPEYTKMANGKYFCGFVKKGCYRTDYTDAYTPIYTEGDKKWFLADDIAEDCDKKVFAQEFDPETGLTETFECKINWPNLPLVVYPGNQVYPITMIFALNNEAGIHIIDGEMYFLIYWSGFDCEETDREKLPESAGVFHAYIFKSSDCGRTWDYFTQLLADKTPDGQAEGYEGYSEPHMAKMPDGSWVMLIRTGSNRKSLISRSVDGCKTWSNPTEFDDIGVFPQILPLPCGVTIATYGRPEMRIRATSDPSGQNWEDSIKIGLSVDKPWESCYYTNLLAVDDTTALMVYSDFQYPDPEGNRVKAILARQIRVVFENN